MNNEQLSALYIYCVLDIYIPGKRTMQNNASWLTQNCLDNKNKCCISYIY